MSVLRELKLDTKGKKKKMKKLLGVVYINFRDDESLRRCSRSEHGTAWDRKSHMLRIKKDCECFPILLTSPLDTLKQ